MSIDMKFATVCSGIEAPTQAWHALGWRAQFFSEVDAHAAALLEYHYPMIQNLGDMTRWRVWGDYEIDLLAGGTPCQAFSVAGKRGSLNDERGNLTLTFCHIADRFDPEFVVWENVPGVLSTDDNAFGCFLGQLCGEDSAIPQPRGGWTHAGVVAGPARTIAWRVLDAQGFVPQRRARVFVVATRAGSRFHPADVLFETEAEAVEHLGDRLYTGPLFPLGEGVRGNPAPRGEAGKDVTGSLSARASGGGGLGTDFDIDGGIQVTHALRAEGHDASEDGTGRGVPLISVLSFDTTQISSPTSRSNPQYGDPCHTILKGAHAPAIAFSSKDHGADAGEIAPCMRAMPHDQSHANAGGQLAVAFQCAGTNVSVDEHTVGTLPASVSAPMMQEAMSVRRLTPVECERLFNMADGYTAVPFRGKPMKDGPRYRLLGNSISIDILRWIGERIDKLVKETK